MATDHTKDQRDRLVDELRNFQEIAEYLNPSPGEIPAVEGVDIAGLSMPLRDVIGGDHILYIDFNRRYDLDVRIAEAEEQGNEAVARNLERLRHRAGILVADVSGHRMTDALIGAMLHQAFLLGVIYELDRFGEITTKLFEHINTRFFRTTAVNKYFTMIYGEIAEDGTFRFLSAGHQPPAVFSREYGHFMKISEDRLVSLPPVGMLPSSSDPDDRVNPSLYGYKKLYEVNEINLLTVGDILLLHTDGLAEHGDGTYFPGELERFLDENVERPAAEICSALESHLRDFAEPEDDVSVVVIRKVG
jgi:serine phosphatase RsbU (regulator of sigma subunit)